MLIKLKLSVEHQQRPLATTRVSLLWQRQGSSTGGDRTTSSGRAHRAHSLVSKGWLATLMTDRMNLFY